MLLSHVTYYKNNNSLRMFILNPRKNCCCKPVIFILLLDTDSDSDAYCDPESIPEPLRYRVQPNVPSAPQKALPPPPSGELSEGEGSDDSGHDYEDPVVDITPSGRVLSLRRGSHPVLNPDAYLALQELDLNATYQDVSFSIFHHHEN